jgi:flagellin
MGAEAFTVTAGMSSIETLKADTDVVFSVVKDGVAVDRPAVSLKAGDDVQEIATRINGQNEGINASVTEKGQLQFISDDGAVAVKSGTLTTEGLLDAATGVPKDGTIVLTAGTGKSEKVAGIDVSSVGGAQKAVATLDSAMKYVDSERSQLGASQNRLNHTINNLNNANENVSASNSRIRDTDFAKETTNMTKNQILSQASTSILAQAKQAPQAALSLLG